MRGLALGCLLLAGCASPPEVAPHQEFEAEATREETIDVSLAKNLVLDLATHAGDVTVEVGEGEPRVVARLRLMARTEGEAERLLERFVVVAHGTSRALTVRLEGQPTEVPGTGALVLPLLSFVARVPPGQSVKAETGSGRVEVRGAAGDCLLETSFGDVRVIGVRGELVRARTNSGSVQIEDVRADRIEVDTAFGDVRVGAVQGDLDVQAGSGDVDLAGFGSGQCTLETGFGNINASGSFVELTAKTDSGAIDVLAEPGSRIAKPWSLHSSFGDVEVRLPQKFECEVIAETSSGSVTSDVAVAGGRRTDQRMSGAIGGGGGRLFLRTSSGDVRIRAY